MPFSRAGFHPAQRQAQQSPDVPSILVETGFISNVRDSQRWVTARHQQAVADGVFEGESTGQQLHRLAAGAENVPSLASSQQLGCR